MCLRLKHINLWVFLNLTLLLISCNPDGNIQEFSSAEKKKLEERISQDHFSIDSIHILLKKSNSERDELAMSVFYKELGERMRESSNFSKAIAYHQQGLLSAYKIKDTIGITQALNNLGTDFRRIGALPEASDYHYQALQMAEAFSLRNEPMGRKNRVMAINGIGNIYLSAGSYEEAERSFREALKEEKILNSHVGQAINYANLGAIFEEKQMYDSAFFYYQRSMEHNVQAKSLMGIGLCHIHIGYIYELQHLYDKAEHTYLLAYDIMNDLTDTWHWLEATLALARINLLKGDFAESKEYIELAKEAANEIHSPEHLSKVYNLLHEYHLGMGNFAGALNDYKISMAFQDSIQNIEKLNKVTDMRLKYERDKNRHFISELNLRNEMETSQKRTILYASFIFVVLLILLLITLMYAYLQRTKSNKILRNLNRIRTNFFTNVTHEFRTPLTVILGLSNHMQNEKYLSLAETKSYLKAIDRQGAHLLSLVNQLLSMSRINAGLDTPEWQKGNIVVYLQMIIDSFRLYAKSKNIQLIFTYNEAIIEMDFVSYYMDDIMQNLLSNAIKFSHPGSNISIQLVTLKQKDVILTVADHGKGISKQEIEHIFDLFYQGTQSDKNNGSGIGLSYCRQLVEMMHGKIEAESEEGQGTIFTITLPLRQSIEANLPLWKIHQPEIFSPVRVIPEIGYPGTASNESHYGEPITGIDRRSTILIIEDNEDVVLYIKALLSARYNVFAERDGVEGLERASELMPDIIISDIMMPNKDGLTLCREIRTSMLLNHIPVILLTAKGTQEDRLKGLQQGADAYIRKPFHLNELLIQIETLIENRRLLKEKYMRAILKGDVSGEKDAGMEFLQKATDIVYSEMQNSHFSTVTLAERLCVSPSQLNRKLSAVSGYTPSLFIMNLRVNCAKKKLASGDKPIGQIAEECGFYDLAYFSRIFKKLTHVSPSQYRRLPM
ncbi:MAG: response regulator [Porphyromonadaceae bacterium]|nr:response regulator [Porphyromonadaceae bacterium]